MKWFGIGKPRSRFGEWLDDHKITQQELSKQSGVSDETIGKLANTHYKPSWRTEKKLMNALRQYDSSATSNDFWDLSKEAKQSIRSRLR